MQGKKRSDNLDPQIRTGKDIEDSDLTYFRSNAELLSEIEDMLSQNEGSSLDEEKLEKYLAILQERAPVMEDYDPSAAWDKLQSEYPAIFDTEERQDQLGFVQSSTKREWQPRLLLRWTEVAIAVLLCFVLTAGALGFNPVKAFLDWAEGIIRVNSNPSGIMELPSDDAREYHSLEEALKKNDIHTNGLPTWVPNDYSLLDVKVRGTDRILRNTAIYESERGEMLIRVTKYMTEDWSAAEEKEDGGYLYSHNDVDYYIITNYEQCKAGWELGSCSYVISGQISEQELKEMINSIT